MRAGRALLRGITLSDAEKANLKAVRQKYAERNKALREQFKPQAKALREAHQRGDTAAVKALIAKNAPQREAAKQLALAERADLRSALTAENQAKFDANLAKLEQRIAQHGKKRKP
jgi:protein CpxP